MVTELAKPLGDTKAPSWGIRAMAHVLDFLLVGFGGLALTATVAPQYAILIAWAALWIHGKATGATAGKQIVGICQITDAGERRLTSSVPARRQWLRAALGVLAVSWAGLTFGGGALIAQLTDEKLNFDAVRIIPKEHRLAEVQSAGAIVHRFENLHFAFPGRIESVSAELSPCCLLFGGEASEHRVHPGVIVTGLQSQHPRSYCTGVAGKVVPFLSRCGSSPAEFQRLLVSVTPRDRWLIWSPIHVAWTNFMLVAKTISLEDMAPGTEVIRIRRDGSEIIWIQAERHITRGEETALVEIDRFMIANDDDYGAVEIIWKKIPRDEELARLVASTLTLEAPSERDVRRELEQENSEHPLLHVMNALRMSGFRADVAAITRDSLRAHGTDRERKLFAISIGHRSSDRAVAAVWSTVASWQENEGPEAAIPE